jgi:uncharacterized membrane protein
MIRWFRSIATGSAPDDPAGSGKGFGAERNPERLVFFSDAVIAIAVTLLLMDIAFLPFAASVLSAAFRTGHGQRTAVVFYGTTFLLAALLFNVIWGYARHDQRLLATTIDAAGARAISRRFRLALVWIATGTLLGALFPVLGMAVIALFIPYYWLPIRGEVASSKPRRPEGGQV